MNKTVKVVVTNEQTGETISVMRGDGVIGVLIKDDCLEEGEPYQAQMFVNGSLSPLDFAITKSSMVEFLDSRLEGHEDMVEKLMTATKKEM